MTTILVTGATGTVGAELVKGLAGRPGVTVRAAVRSSSARVPAGATAVPFDFADEALAAAALEGVDRVYLLNPPGPDPVSSVARLLAQARAAGVKHVVKLSGLGCDREAIAFGRAHRAVEQLIEGSGLAFTFVRPNNFMDNFLGERHGAFAFDARGELRLPWGDAACSFVAASDIAAVAAAALTGDGHEGKAYEVTGPEALRMDEVAAIISAASGRPHRYVDVPEAVAREDLARAKMPPPVVAAVLELHAIGKAGRTATVTSTVQEVTGRPARTFRAFADAHAAVWRAPRGAAEEVSR